MRPNGRWIDRVLGEHSPSRLARLVARHEELAWAIGAGFLLLLSFLFSLQDDTPLWAVRLGYLVVGVICGYLPVRHLLTGLVKGEFRFDIDLLMVVAAIGAAIVGAWAEGAFLLFLFALANALERYALDRARGAIRALVELVPDTARVLIDGQEQVLPIERVRRGDLVVVRPAERIAVDGVVRAGSSSVDQAPITGESVPVIKAIGDEVFAGTVNGDGALEVTVTAAIGDRTLDRVIRLVESSRSAKAPTERAAERFERWFVPLVLIADLLLIVVPPLLGAMDWSSAFYRGMTVLVAASPCALALGPPAVMLAGIAQAARRGILIKGGVHLENLATIKAIAFDKTGTLTIGRPEVTDVVPFPGVTRQQLLAVAAAVESRSQHPLAQAVVRRAAQDGLDLPRAGDLVSITAKGVRSEVEGEPVLIGSLRLWQRADDLPPAEVVDAVSQVAARGRSVMVVRHGSRWLGVLGLADKPRESVGPTLNRLRSMGIAPLVMLTGDHRAVGDAIGREVGVDLVVADLLPEHKVTALNELMTRHGAVAMVGDGVNDAPALAAATVGVAMGGAGTAAALETADAALMGDDLARLPFAIALARRARRLLNQNLVIAGGMMVLLLVFAATGQLGIGPAVVGHEGSTLVVIANALRMLRFEQRS
jgi:Cd2+/Zn2+-exporting ATPase